MYDIYPIEFYLNCEIQRKFAMFTLSFPPHNDFWEPSFLFIYFISTPHHVYLGYHAYLEPEREYNMVESFEKRLKIKYKVINQSENS